MGAHDSRAASGGRALRGSRALVTGAARGIGEAVAARLAREGAWVTAADVSAEPAWVRGMPGVESVVLDVTDASEVDRLFAEADPPFDITVANAGVHPGRAPILTTDPAEWNRTISVNLTGVFHTLRSAARALVAARKPGSIIVTASIGGLIGSTTAVSYGASKFGAVGLIRSAARELAPHGISVNCVCPGEVDTSMHGLLRAKWAQAVGAGDEEILANIVAGIPMGRMATPEEISGVYSFLAGPDARYITGTTLVVDGGEIA